MRTAFLFLLALLLGCAQGHGEAPHVVYTCQPTPTTAPVAVLVSPKAGANAVAVSTNTLTVSFPGTIYEIDISPAVDGKIAFPASANADAMHDFSATLSGSLAANTSYSVRAVGDDSAVCAFGNTYPAGTFST